MRWSGARKKIVRNAFIVIQILIFCEVYHQKSHEQIFYILNSVRVTFSDAYIKVLVKFPQTKIVG